MVRPPSFLLLIASVVACGDSSSTDTTGSGASGGGASATTGSGSGSTGTGSTTTGAATSSTSSGTGGALPGYATFHLNYTQDIDFAKCAERDFVVLDMADTPASVMDQCKGMGATMLCYFSSQYEEWRDDAGAFGALDGPLDGWPGERWVDPDDPANLAVMIARLDAAVAKGCQGVDVDNIDRDGHEVYIATIFQEARTRGLLVSQKNAIEKIDLFWDLVDLYQNEECQAYDECDAYASLGRPVYNIEYAPCQTIDYLYSHRKDVEAMDAWEEPCAP